MGDARPHVRLVLRDPEQLGRGEAGQCVVAGDLDQPLRADRRADLVALSRWLALRNIQIAQTTRADLLGFIAWRVEAGARPRSTARQLSSFRRFFRHELREGAYRFSSRARGQSELIIEELIDPEGETVASLAEVEGEGSTGALALAQSLELITFDTWLFGQVGDKEELDLKDESHWEVWFNFGSWIGETIRRRHGGHWLLMGDDPHTWRIGFSKIFLEIAPFAFAPIPFIVWGSVRFQRRLEPRYAAVRDKVGVLNASLANNLSGVATIKAFTAERREADRIAAGSQRYAQANRDAIRLSSAFVPLIRMAILTGFTAILVLGGMRALDGQLEQVGALPDALRRSGGAEDRQRSPRAEVVGAEQVHLPVERLDGDRLKAGFTAMSIVIPTALIVWVNFDADIAASLASSYPGRVALMTTALNVGAIVALSPALDEATKAEFRTWGPGMYDPRHHTFDGTNLISLNSPSLPIVIPPIYGLKGVDFETFQKAAIERIPVRRVGQPEDVAALVSFLASEESGFVSGQVIYIAGGPLN